SLLRPAAGRWGWGAPPATVAPRGAAGRRQQAARSPWPGTVAPSLTGQSRTRLPSPSGLTGPRRRHLQGENMSGWNFAEIWETVAQQVPDAQAQVQGDRRYTWAEFDRRANGVAQALLDAGVQ